MTQFRACLSADLFRVSGGMPLWHRGFPNPPPRRVDRIGVLTMDADSQTLTVRIQRAGPPPETLPPGSLAVDEMQLERLQWGYGGFPRPPGVSRPRSCIRDFRGDWVIVEPADATAEARRIVFDEMVVLLPGVACNPRPFAPPLGEALATVVVFRDQLRQFELSCRTLGSECFLWERGVLVGRIVEGTRLKTFTVELGMQGPPSSMTNVRRLVAVRVE